MSNPERLSNEINLMSGAGSGLGSTIKSTLYNKQFTDKLLSLSNGWCKKPNADFAKTNTTPSTTA